MKYQVCEEKEANSIFYSHSLDSLVVSMNTSSNTILVRDKSGQKRWLSFEVGVIKKTHNS